MKTITFQVSSESHELLKINARRAGRTLASYVRAAIFVRVGITPDEDTSTFKERRRKFIDDLKSVPCQDCKNVFPPAAMDFDHRETSEKGFNVSAGMYGNEKLLLDEIAKCDVVCSNCHRVRTMARHTSGTPDPADTEVFSTPEELVVIKNFSGQSA